MRMKHDPISSGKRKSVNLSIDTGVVAAARDLGINLSRVTETALRVATKNEAERAWRERNRDWIADFARAYEADGDPLAHLEPL